MAKPKDVADQVRNASSPADVERITSDLTPEQREALARELESK